MADLSYDDVLARNIRAARARLGLTQQSLANRMRSLGYTAWLRQTVPNVEKGNRRVLAGEILGLAFSLETTIPALMSVSPDDKIVQLPSGDRIEAAPGVPGVNPAYAVTVAGFGPGALTWQGDIPVFPAGRPARFGEAEDDPNLLPRPVAVAIVTSGLGVLVGERNDGTPPWTFIAGEVEPGERPDDAAVREVKEETGVLVRAGRIIGERVHPRTGRQMIYLAAKPTHGTDYHVGDEAELAAVKWAGLSEALSLMPDMYEPVRQYLARELEQ